MVTKSSESTMNNGKLDKQNIMLDAWNIARDGARRFGGSSRTYFDKALSQAWARAKAANIARFTGEPSDQTYFICVDLGTANKTRIADQPAVRTVYTSRENAHCALEVLGQAFTKPFIKTSKFYNLSAHGCW